MEIYTNDEKTLEILQRIKEKLQDNYTLKEDEEDEFYLSDSLGIYVRNFRHYYEEAREKIGENYNNDKSALMEFYLRIKFKIVILPYKKELFQLALPTVRTLFEVEPLLNVYKLKCFAITIDYDNNELEIICEPDYPENFINRKKDK